MHLSNSVLESVCDFVIKTTPEDFNPEKLPFLQDENWKEFLNEVTLLKSTLYKGNDLDQLKRTMISKVLKNPRFKRLISHIVHHLTEQKLEFINKLSYTPRFNFINFKILNEEKTLHIHRSCYSTDLLEENVSKTKKPVKFDLSVNKDKDLCLTVLFPPLKSKRITKQYIKAPTMVCYLVMFPDTVTNLFLIGVFVRYVIYRKNEYGTYTDRGLDTKGISKLFAVRVVSGHNFYDITEFPVVEFDLLRDYNWASKVNYVRGSVYHTACTLCDHYRYTLEYIIDSTKKKKLIEQSELLKRYLKEYDKVVKWIDERYETSSTGVCYASVDDEEEI